MFSFAKKLVDKLEGGSVSTESSNSDLYFKDCLKINNKGYGLRVLKVEAHSVAHEKGLESWFDYIVKVNDHELPMLYPSVSNYACSVNDDGTINYGNDTTAEQARLVNFDNLRQELGNMVRNEMGSKELVLDVWSAKGGVVRKVILPLESVKKDQESSLVEASDFSLSQGLFSGLGMTLESQHLNSATYVWRILTTHQGSPAFKAQLVPYSDYIIGCDSAKSQDSEGKGLLYKGGEALLSRTVLSYYNRHYSTTGEDHVPITLYVYNHDYDILRPVTVNLTRAWGTGHNKGILGCDVGYGLLHRIPEVVGKFSSEVIVDDVLFESQHNFSYGQVPDQPSPAFPPPAAGNSSVFVPSEVAPAKRTVAKKKKHSVSANALGDLNDYMNEELENSSKRDALVNKPAENATAPPPPPPPKAN